MIAFGLSTLAPMPYRLIIWYSSMLMELIIDYLKFRSVPFNGSHLPERFGLFTIVVLGEAVLQVIEALSITVADDKVTSWVLAGFGIAIAYSLWWIYFNDFSGQVMKDKSRLSNTWLYLHLPLHMSHALLGALVSSILSAEGLVSITMARIFFLNNAVIFFCNAALKMVLTLSEYREEHGVTHDFGTSPSLPLWRMPTNFPKIYSLAFAGAAAAARFLMGVVLLLCMLISENQLTQLVVMGIMLGCCIFQVVVDITVEIFENRYLISLEQQWENQEREETQSSEDDDDVASHLIHKPEDDD